MTSGLDQDKITAIVTDSGLDDAEVNRKITSGYHQLSEAIREELGAGDNLDWCGFAKWSSHTVGLDLNPHLVGAEIDELANRTVDSILGILPTLPKEHLPNLESLLLRAGIREPVTRLSGLLSLVDRLTLPGSLAARIRAGLESPASLKPALHAAIVQLLREAADVDNHLPVRALRFGNTHIFRDMGAVFLRLTELIQHQRRRNDGSDTDFAKRVINDAGEIVKKAMGTPLRAVPEGLTGDLIDTLQPDNPDPRLVKGIEFYVRASRDPDPVRRAELMWAGSMKFSMYEQAVADRLIAIGICAPVRARLLPVVSTLSPEPVDPKVLHDEVLLAGPGDDPAPIRGVVRGVTEKLTNEILVVEIAKTRVPLGHREQLEQLTRQEHLPPPVTPTLPETIGVMDEVTLPAVGLTPNWTKLTYRLGFIAKYFATFQQYHNALQEPDVPLSPAAGHSDA